MYRKGVILLFPSIKTFPAKKALDVVSGVPGWVEKEAGFGEGVGCCNEVIGVGPFKGDDTLGI
jgi:hypothetical protein